MLKPEEAEKELKKLVVKRAEALSRERMGSTTDRLREPGFAFLNCSKTGKPVKDWEKLNALHEKAGKKLDAMSKKDRRVVFEALCPKLATHLECGWELLKHTPYQIGWGRRGFRAPNNNKLTAASRFSWVQTVANATNEYDQDILWFAEWYTYLNLWNGSDFGLLFAVAIDSGGAEGEGVFEILRAAANGEHEIAGMGDHICHALLSCSKPEAWEFMEGFLLAAQRQEGLRQSILEAIDFAHPEAFRRMLRLILEENLVRFSSVVRAADVWFGLAWDSVSAAVIKKTITQVLEFLEAPDRAEEAIARQVADPEAGETVYLALWTLAFNDVYQAIPKAAALLVSPSKKAKGKAIVPCVEARFAATTFLVSLDLDESAKTLAPALQDEDMRVATLAIQGISEAIPDTFEILESQLDRFPEKAKKMESLIWPWMELTVSRSAVATAMLSNFGTRPVERLLPFLSYLGPWERSTAADMLGRAPKKLSAEGRDTLVRLMKDASADVRQSAVQGVSKLKLDESEMEFAESLLTRKSSDLRRGLLQLILNQEKGAAMASAQRLVESGKVLQRLAGLELLELFIEKETAVEQCLKIAEDFAQRRGGKMSKEEQTLLTALRSASEKPLTLEDGLGLMDRSRLTLAPPPKMKRFKIDTPAAVGVIQDLNRLIHENRKQEITFENYDDEEATEILGAISWRFPTPDRDKPVSEQWQKLPLREVWETWLVERNTKLRDKDGLELLRALMLIAMDDAASNSDTKGWLRKGYEKVYGKPTKLAKLKLPHAQLVQYVLQWLVGVEPREEMLDFVLDAIESEMAAVPFDLKVEQLKDHWSYLADDDKPKSKEKKLLCEWTSWRDWCDPILPMTKMWDLFYGLLFYGGLTLRQKERYFWLIRWWDMPTKGTANNFELIPDADRCRVETSKLAWMHAAGKVNDDDAIDHFIGPRGVDAWSGEGFDGIQEVTTRTKVESLGDCKAFLEIGRQCTDRVVEVELTRGENPGTATDAAVAIRSLHGTDKFIEILSVLGKSNLNRTWSYHNNSRNVVFSELLRRIFPDPKDTAETFSVLVKAEEIPESRLIQIALFAPQWVGFVGAHLGWEGFSDAVWWIHAHTKDDQWSVDTEVREQWAAEISERTQLTSQDLVDGAVDVAWFHQVYNQLGKKRWNLVVDEARYASGGGGHTRAQVFAEAMLGVMKKTDMVKRIRDKRHQDTVRALGLLPLARGKGKDSDLLSRYQEMQEFIRTSRQFGSQRQASEKRAATIGQENLARTAGYPDPIRLQWDMEAREISDMKDGVLTASKGEVEVRLEIGEWGEIAIEVKKADKVLKSIPVGVRKDKAIKALTERRTILKRQASRMRKSLEAMMCRGEAFSRDEVAKLLEHPLLAPMLRGLILVGVDDPKLLGYPSKNGKALETFDDKCEVIGKKEAVRIAHPHDLLTSKKWSKWQRDCLARERVQPFKQVFRELYPLNKEEKAKKTTLSNRYAGHQVNPRQAMALFGGRGWVTAPEEGVRRTFHDEEISAYVVFEESFYTPADVEGLTLAGVQFVRRGTHDALPLSKVPPRVFSEVMRDIDLAVSVAHRGGVDPEASSSTIEMRGSLVVESTAVLGLKNVKVKENHVMVDGDLGEYSIHLGSAMTHIIPGGALYIVAVQSQHRGRLFLPFADDDPKTAEVLSKVLLLARDTEIKDPSILNQIRAARGGKVTATSPNCARAILVIRVTRSGIALLQSRFSNQRAGGGQIPSSSQ
ncbi:MAG: DUF5724 domain-containing protein [Verrucomicrobiales bacterium]|nr:DUF5724 domain-containing protein [Verrucomicrobiales bacterium]